MSSRMQIYRSTESSSHALERLRSEIDRAEAIVIGAGAGLSTAAGFTYSGARFDAHFADFGEKYGFTDMYSGGFYPYAAPEEKWAYWSRYIMVNRYADPPKPVYDDLLKLVRNKDFFVITTNVDHCFQKAGFDKQRLFYTQGDYGLFQCSEPCHMATYDNKTIIREMMTRQEAMRVPAELLPVCPRCGKPMTMNLRSDDHFVEDAGWHAAARGYENFLRTHANGRILFLELGVGFNTPGIIKYPFWRMTDANGKAVYACINDGEAFCPEKIKAQSICISGDIAQILERISP